MATRADEDDFTGILYHPDKRCVEAVAISTLGANMDFLIYLYWNRFFCLVVQNSALHRRMNTVILLSQSDLEL